MSNQVDRYDRAREPRDRFHPQHDSFRDWLDTAAPADQCQKLRNRPKWRRTQVKLGITCHACRCAFPADKIIAHLQDVHRQVRA